MSPPRVRPRFELQIPDDPERVMEMLRARLPRCPDCAGVSAGRHAELFVPQAERRFFSPWLSVTAEADGDGARVRGRFGPHPSLWTGYMVGFFALGTTAVLAATWAYAQWALAHPPRALWCVAVSAVLAGALYVASLVGQRLGEHQMDALRDALAHLTAPAGDGSAGPVPSRGAATRAPETDPGEREQRPAEAGEEA